ncbi:hypothetical protein [Micromonospora zamorensis]|uniref:hypothetical protein n=1 Tax=Micromonospora zamorensis TaxID=709883 RepID=UPI002E18143A
MNWRQFIASVVQTLAWPLTVLIVVLLFRKKINMLLGDRLRRLTAGPVEAEWADSVGVAQAAVESERPAENQPIPPPGQDRSASESEEPSQRQQPESEHSAEPQQSEIEPESERAGQHPEPQLVPEPRPDSDQTTVPGDGTSQRGETPTKAKADSVPQDTELPRLVRLAMVQAESARRVAKSNPATAVIMGYKALDVALKHVADASDPIAYHAETPHGVAKMLASKGLIGPGTFRAISELSKLRNSLMHTRLEISDGDALLYLNTLEDILRTLLHPAELYESQVAAALARQDLDVTRSTGGADLLVLTESGALALELKYMPGRILTWKTVEQLAAKAARERLSLLVVTNAELDKSVQERNSSGDTIFGCRVEVVTWKSPSDDDLLLRAALRNAVF